IAVSRCAAASRCAKRASSRASAEPIGRGSVKRLPGAREGNCMTDSRIRPMTNCYALVPCAGIGTRAGAGGPKQYRRLAGRAVVAHTLDALQRVPRIAATLVVLSADDAQFEQHVPGFTGWIARRGGATRAQTVANGLDELVARGAQPHDWVLVHDAARCLI